MTIGVRAPTFLSQPKSISIPTSVSSLFPICLTTGNSPSLMPASESAIVDVSKPISITLCSSPPCSTNVAAVVSASAGSIPDKAQVCALHVISRGFILKPAPGSRHDPTKTSQQQRHQSQCDRDDFCLGHGFKQYRGQARFRKNIFIQRRCYWSFFCSPAVGPLCRHFFQQRPVCQSTLTEI